MDYARVLKLPQYFRNLQRLSEIVSVLVRHGFGDLVKRMNLSPYLETGMRVFQIPLASQQVNSSLDFPQRLRMVCEELGPTFIKFAQIVASRPDVFPINITQEFRKLQDNVPAFPAAHARELIEQEFGKSIDSCFQSFEDQPLAAASIAQVHRAVLRDGTAVVLKVQRPQLDRIIDTDLDILRGLATLIEENIPESTRFSPTKLIEEFARSLRYECDFRRESHNTRRFAENFKNEPGLIVPQIYPEMCTHRVLCEQYVAGFRADDLENIKKHQINGKAIAEILCRVVLKSIFEDRFFHADPHAGNVFITADNRVAFVDFGAMGRLDTIRLYQILQFLAAILSKDLDRMVRVLKEHSLVPIFVDEISLKNEVSEILDAYWGQPLGALDLAELVSNIFEVVRRFGVKPPPDLLLIGKSLTTLEYLGALLDPEFDPLKTIQPTVLKLYAAQVTNPRLYLAQIGEMADDYRKFLMDLPQGVRAILRALSRDELVINTKSKDLNEIRKHQNKMLNRALMTLVGIALMSIGALMNILQHNASHLSVSFALMIWGAIILLLSWISIRKTGGSN